MHHLLDPKDWDVFKILGDNLILQLNFGTKTQSNKGARRSVCQARLCPLAALRIGSYQQSSFSRKTVHWQRLAVRYRLQVIVYRL